MGADFMSTGHPAGQYFCCQFYLDEVPADREERSQSVRCVSLPSIGVFTFVFLAFSCG
jgi:hypothetical protein